jgi:hypothetical protein
MNNITKVSEITAQDIADYIRLDELTTDDKNTINTLLNISKAFIQGYTGLTANKIDTHPDLVIVVLILCQDMWDNRTMYVDNANLNKVVDTILGMHVTNLL